MTLPILYDGKVTEVVNQGYGIMGDTRTCEVTEERNGPFELEMSYPTNGPMREYINNEMLIGAKPNGTDDRHLFRIYNVRDTTSDGLCHIQAASITNDLNDNLIRFSYLTNYTVKETVKMWMVQLLEPSNITIETTMTSKYKMQWEFELRNPLNALMGDSDSLVSRVGGDIKRTNNSIILMHDRGVKVDSFILQPGKNISGIEYEVDTKDLITSVMPYCKLDDNEFYLRGSIFNSPMINNYPTKHIAAIDYSEFEPKTTGDLDRLVQQYFIADNLNADYPYIKVKVDAMSLPDSAEYSYLKATEQIRVCDTIPLYYKKFNLNMGVKVSKLVYNSLADKVISFEADRNTRRNVIVED